MDKLKLKYKILLILLLPILTITTLSILKIYDELNKKSATMYSKNYLEFSKDTSNLISSLQKERSVSLIYLLNYGESFKAEMLLENKNSDKFIKIFYKNILNIKENFYSKESETLYKNLEIKLKDIIEKEKR